MIETASHVALAMLALALLLTLVRLLRSGAADRIVALDLLTILAVCSTGVLAVLHRDALFLDVAVVVSLVAFVATVAFARYLESSR